MSNKVFVHKDCRDVIIPILYGKKQKQENILLMTTVLNQLFFDQIEKVLLGKHISFLWGSL